MYYKHTMIQGSVSVHEKTLSGGPYSASALAHDDGTRQEIMGSESESESGGPGPEIQDLCSQGLQIIDRIMNDGRSLCDEDYLTLRDIFGSISSNH